MIEEAAPAKINLYLHVGPTRADGLHLIESLFVFAAAGDVVRAAPAERLSLEIVGPFAGALAGFPIEDNLVMRAARALGAAEGVRSGARLVLDKRLPVAAGIGGGSADAAAALRALVRLWNIDPPRAELARLAFALGADVPACLDGRPVYVGGAGEDIAEGPALPPVWACLVNPGVATPTGPIFRAFDAATPTPGVPRRERPRRIATLHELQDFLSPMRNDLEVHAVRRETVIGAAREYLASSPGAFFSRMSGSGATVFALYASEASAERAARGASARGWWSVAARIARSGRRGEDGELQ